MTDKPELPPLPAPSDPHRIGGQLCAFNSSDMRAYGAACAAHERERCAKVALTCDIGPCPSIHNQRDMIAAAIRAGEPS